MNAILTKLKPTVPKRYLIFIAAFAWAFAGAMLLWRGENMLASYPEEIWWKVLISIPLGIVFYVFMFSKIYRKHTKRLNSITHEKACVFSFFNWKSYIMMIFMMGMGIFLRTSELISIRYLSILYVTMSIPLCISSIMFFITGIKQNNSLSKN